MPRSTVPAKVLNRMLSDCAASTPQCALCRLGTVVEVPIDETGCNWKVSRVEGCHSGDCFLAMEDFIAGLRAEFLLEDPNMSDPTLLTTWAGL